MRDDLQDAFAAVKWAETQIAGLKERFITWQRRNPFEVVVQPDPGQSQSHLLVAYQRLPLDSLIQPDVGAIINSTRTALDLLMSALLKRNGATPNQDANFPIRKMKSDFLSRVAMFESNGWLSRTEAAAIKRTKAYEGGDHFLYPLHKLDILRKHERLLIIEPKISGGGITSMGHPTHPVFEQVGDKIILLRIPAALAFRPTRGNTLLTAEMLFDEPTLLSTHQPADGVLQNFTERVSALVLAFDT